MQNTEDSIKEISALMDKKHMCNHNSSRDKDMQQSHLFKYFMFFQNCQKNSYALFREKNPIKDLSKNNIIMED